MNNQFIYSILQYKHSLILGESVNIGILFSFPNENSFEFVIGDTKRLSCLYPDFDPKIITQIANNISNKLNKQSNETPTLFTSTRNFQERLNSLLIEDASSLQFSQTYTSVKPFESNSKVIEEFSRILLPNIDGKAGIIRRDDIYLRRKYENEVFIKANKIREVKLELRFSKDVPVYANKISLTFDYGWKNETLTHLVKPVSLDYNQASRIQEKSVRYWGYITLLAKYGELNNFSYDLLVSKPQEKELWKAYDDALERLYDIDARKNIITEENFEAYTDLTAQNISKEVL